MSNSEILGSIEADLRRLAEIIHKLRTTETASTHPHAPAAAPKYPNIHWAKNKDGQEVPRSGFDLHQTQNVKFSKSEDQKFLTVTWQELKEGDRAREFRASCWDASLAELIVSCAGNKTAMEFMTVRSNNWINIVGVTTPTKINV